MDFDHYQRKAAQTRKKPAGEGSELFVTLLGLAGETGQLLSEYKKSIRDGPSHELHKERVGEELGDLLWYLSNVADQFGLRLNHVARTNLQKITARWGGAQQRTTAMNASAPLDANSPVRERLPRNGTVEIRPVGEVKGRIRTIVNGKKMGQDLTDNAHIEDGYRLHDIFHLACMTLLGWSPVIRKGLKVKRKSDETIDEVEDGGRAIVIEEGVSALVFSYASRHRMLARIQVLDYPLLRTIKQMTEHLEVRVRTEADWERTILKAYDVWREAIPFGGGRIAFDSDAGVFAFIGSPRPVTRARKLRKLRKSK